MRRHTFRVAAIWDAKAKVYYSESDIEGLHIEADTIEEFEDVMYDLVFDLAVSNHLNKPDMFDKPLKDWIPAILWQRPTDANLAMA